MNKIFQFVRWLWWLCVAAIPPALITLKQAYRTRIGCPTEGDCYVPGWDLLFEWNVVIGLVVVLLWPVCFFYVVVAPLSFLASRRPSHVA